jgi:hypothetical protein
MIDLGKMEEFLNSDCNLPVSEEMIGAYAEGKLYGSDYMMVNNAINDYPELNDFLSEDSEDEFSMHYGSLGNEESFNIPDLPVLPETWGKDSALVQSTGDDLYIMSASEPASKQTFEEYEDTNIGGHDLSDNYFEEGDSFDDNDESLSTDNTSDIDDTDDLFND